MVKVYIKSLLSLIALPYAVDAVTADLAEGSTATLNATDLESRGWHGVKAYPYSPNCGGDGDVTGTTWTYLGDGCVTYNQNGQNLDMWSISWGDYDTIAEWLDCTDPCYDVSVLMYHSSYTCTSQNIGPTPMGGVGYGCASIGESIKSFRLDCGPSDNCA